MYNICELKEVVSRQTTLITANQIHTYVNKVYNSKGKVSKYRRSYAEQ
jgi:hypothetical protein